MARLEKTRAMRAEGQEYWVRCSEATRSGRQNYGRDK